MKSTLIVMAAALVTALLGVNVFAGNTGHNKMKITFSAPVQVPGMVLPAGSYVFSLLNSGSHNIVLIQDASGKNVAQALAFADYRSKTTNHAVVLFGEGSCVPQAVKAWFYPGAQYGTRFIYPKDEAQQIATGCHEPVPETEASTTDSSQPVHVLTQDQKEKDYSPDAFQQSDMNTSNGVDAQQQ